MGEAETGPVLASPDTNAAFLALLAERTALQVQQDAEYQALEQKHAVALAAWWERWHALTLAHAGETIILPGAPADSTYSPMEEPDL